MKVYTYEHNTGPSWSSDPVTIVGIYSTFEVALSDIPKEVKRYEETDKDHYVWHGLSPSIKGSTPVWAAGGDGWWWAIFEVEVK